ncbi:winged helix-turn-helix transcriptional regulator [Nocardia sp. NPDC057227]|uniref:winged helix-turn-helix transcriptional regulator n=1 Tax=Nocardia sp. NPDC057227 TaxID=3346056 RepID=UPI003636928B
MTRRSYNQYCGLSRTLDLVGERWTLLIVRELMSGAKRYSDLASALDGIGTSVLAARMRQLDEDGLVTRTQLPPPAASQVYELSSAGRELAAAMVPLALWGLAHRLDEPRHPEETYRAEWALVFLAATLDPAALTGLRLVIQFHIDGSSAHLTLDDGTAAVTPGAAGRADATVTTDLRTLAELVTRPIDRAALAERVRLTGQPEVLATVLDLLPATVLPA